METTIFQDIIFWVLAVASVLAALGVVLIRDIFRAALLLVLVFLAVAGFFVMMNAEFLAVVQVLIYAGAIAVLIIFAIMLTREVQQGNLPNRLQAAAVFFPALLLAAVIFVAIDTDWELLEDQPAALQEQIEAVQTNSIGGIPIEEQARLGLDDEAHRSSIGELLINDFVLPFEAAAVLLLASIIGALVLVRER
jgi:NADH-quinone oxidoreductase subunit J